MTDNRPILIAGPPRSGTTMLAGLLGKHGVWIGRGRTTRYPGTNPEFVSENQDIKRLMKWQASWLGYRNWTTPLPEQPNSWLITYEALNKIVPNNVRWLVKTSWTLIFSEFWKAHFPNALWIFPYRRYADILDSMNRHPSMRHHPHEVKCNYIDALLERQQELTQEVYYTFVDVKKISQLNWEEIHRLFEFISTPADRTIVTEWIEPELMK